MKKLYPAVLQPEPEGGFTVLFPDLPNCVTYGDDLQNALEMAQEALGLYLVSLEEYKKPIPTASNINEIIAQSIDTVIPVMVEVNQYRRNNSVNTLTPTSYTSPKLLLS